MAENIDKLYKELWGDDGLNDLIAPEMIKPQRESVITIEGDAYNPTKETPIEALSDKPLTKEAELVRQNFNERINMGAQDAERYSKEIKPELQIRDQAGSVLSSIARSLPEIARQASDVQSRPRTDYSDLVKKAQGDYADASAPDEVNRWAEVINAFGPGVLGLAMGGNAGYKAAGEVGPQIMKQQEERLKRMIEAKKDRKNAASNQLASIGKLQEGEARMIETDAKRKNEDAKLQIETLMKSANLTKEQAELVKSEIDRMQSASIASDKDSLAAMERGTNKSVDMEQAQLNRDSSLEKSKIAAEASKERAKEISKRPYRSWQEKPPTEGERKAATALGQLENAENTYKNFIDKHKYNPAESSSFPGFWASLNQISNPKDILMGEMFKTIQDPKLRRAIELESQWLAPKLRKDSGAAISVGEFLFERPIHFGRRGDPPGAYLEKETARRQYMDGVRGEVGRAREIPVLTQRTTPAPQIQKADKILGKGKYAVTYSWDGKQWVPKGK